MRLCIATPLYPPESGGPATYARLLEEHMPPKGVEVALVKFSEVRHLPPALRHLVYLFRLLKAGKGTDVMLALDPVSTGLAAACAARILRIPFVVKVVGDWAWEQGTQRYGVSFTLDEFVHAKKLPLAVRFFQSIETWVARQANFIIVPSEYLRAVVNVWGIPPEKIFVIHNAMQVETPTAPPEETEQLSRPRIVTVGRLVPWKGIDGVIDSVVLLREKFPTASLVVVGDGPDRAVLEARARSKLGQNLVFTGQRTHGETLATMRNADVFVLNSTYEGLSHLLIEALSLGVPIVTTRVGGNPELITDQENGLLIESGNPKALAQACERILEDDTFRAHLKEGAKERAKQFSVEVMIEKTSTMLRILT